MSRTPGRRRQINIGFSQEQHEWLGAQARKRGIAKAEFVRRLVDGMMLGDNTMSRGVDWQSQTLADPPTPTPIEDIRELRRAFSYPPGYAADNLPTPAKSQGRATYLGIETIEGVKLTSTPMGPNHPFYKEYVEALRAGDHQKAARLRFGTAASPVKEE